ncbi:MAG: tetratricopeptide repeat protein [Bacteroidales bacterium]|nr:tetratricopeptide repeat protein [Bacteroidales bacterium]
MKKICSILLAICILISCGKKDDVTGQTAGPTPVQQVQSLAPQAVIGLYKEVDSLIQIGRPNLEKTQQFAEQAASYAEANPEDTLSPKFLLQAGICQRVVAFSTSAKEKRDELALKAISYLDRLRNHYPDYKNLDYALFQKGQILEQLGRWKDAKETYCEIVTRFPKSELGKNMAEYIKMSGYTKSAEEIYQGFHDQKK